MLMRRRVPKGLLNIAKLITRLQVKVAREVQVAAPADPLASFYHIKNDVQEKGTPVIGPLVRYIDEGAEPVSHR